MERSNEARAAVNVICASVNGNSVHNSKSQKKVVRILGLPIIRSSDGKAIRTMFLTSKNEVSLHVSVIYRHSILEGDGVDSSDVHPNIINEHLFLISLDLNHDHKFSQYPQLQVAEYLRSIHYECSGMCEFTDECPCQYKGRHCMGGISVDKSTLGYDKVIRNYFENSQRKGPNDAAGGQIKNQADLAVWRGKIQIRSAKDLYNFAEEHLQVPKFSLNCRRRMFRVSVHSDSSWWIVFTS
ncbi:hypothetical protein KUTeg_010427 [Tegillarca granosa]|uniref:Uncharacterized protein n=1 Tax=Tegillarca granosa TaxID=220873 RepID=A0ABQ9F6P7_TEGGR|nr:hypothetical protein KUTeg_010427 [Tegillarca granosa]